MSILQAVQTLPGHLVPSRSDSTSATEQALPQAQHVQLRSVSSLKGAQDKDYRALPEANLEAVVE